MPAAACYHSVYLSTHTHTHKASIRGSAIFKHCRNNTTQSKTAVTYYRTCKNLLRAQQPVLLLRVLLHVISGPEAFPGPRKANHQQNLFK